MMAVRKSSAQWRGTLKAGQGTVKLGSGAFEGPYSFPSRFNSGAGANPEELIGAAHAGCFSMAFAMLLENAGYPATRVDTTAKVHLEPASGGFAITRIELITEAQVPGIADEVFQERAQAAKVSCPVSKALTGTDITLVAQLVV